LSKQKQKEAKKKTSTSQHHEPIRFYFCGFSTH